MMRDDVLRKRLKAERPSPTPLFSGRVRQALDQLPERRKPSPFMFLPAAVMAVIAVAVIGLAVASRINPDNQNNWFQALTGGEETTAAAEVTPAPTPDSLTTTPPGENTPGESLNAMSPVNVSGTDKGIISTVLQAYTDGKVLSMEIKAGPFAEYTTPAGQITVNIDGNTSTINGDGIRPSGGDAWEGDSSAGYCTYTVTIPLTQEITSDTARIELEDEYNIPSDIYIDSEEEEAALTFTKATIKLSFDLPIHMIEAQGKPTPAPDESTSEPEATPAPTPASPEQAMTTAAPPEATAMSTYANISGTGKIGFGNNVRLAEIKTSPTQFVYIIEVEANDKLKEYVATHDTDGNNIVDIKPDYPDLLLFVLVRGHVDESFVATEDEKAILFLQISAGDDDEKRGIYVRNISASIQSIDDGKHYSFYITAENTGFNPANDFTILTIHNTEQGKTSIYAWPYSVQ